MCSRYIRAFSTATCKYYNYSSILKTEIRIKPMKLFSTSSNIYINDQSKINEKHDGSSPEESEEKINEMPMTEKEKEILEKNQQLLERLKEIDDKYKRSLAENENIRMRMRREIADAKQYGIQSFVKDLLDVSDVLSKATESVPKDALTNDNQYLKNLFVGLQMTEAQLQSVYRRYGISHVNPIGEKFDPNMHEALFEHEDPSKEPGTVAMVTKIGYKLHDRIIRPALVGVIKSR